MTEGAQRLHCPELYGVLCYYDDCDYDNDDMMVTMMKHFLVNMH